MAKLQITYGELRRHISRFAGVGRAESDYSSDTARLADVNDAMYSGLRSFYWPATPHRWSFMEVDATILLEVGKSTYMLPSNFARLTGQFRYPDDSGKRPIAPVDAKHIRAWRATKDVSADPVYCAVDSKDNGDGGRSLSEVVFYPTPSEATTLTYSMEVEPFVPDAIYDDTSPLGGAIHSEVILEACLASAERVFNAESGPGYHSAKFMELLAAAIEIDKNASGEMAEADTWPLDGVSGGVSSLAVTKSQLERLIGRAMGYTPNPQVWSHGQASSVAECLRSGLRRFYQPMTLPGQRWAHQWSFLSPCYDLLLVADKWQYDLPEDFTGVIDGKITYKPGSSTIYPPIRLVKEEHIRDLLQTEVSSTRPAVAAIRVKQGTENTGTRYELLLAPIPSEELQITIPYSINAEQLGSDTALPMGGQPHAQTIIEACLAATEIYMKSGNVHQNEFLNCLKTSVDHDLLIHRPETVGYSGDSSDWDYRDFSMRERWMDGNSLTTYNGTVPV